MFVKIVTRRYTDGKLSSTTNHIFECQNLWVIDEIFQDENSEEHFNVKYSFESADNSSSVVEYVSKDEQLSLYIMNDSGKTIEHFHFRWDDKQT